MAFAACVCLVVVVVVVVAGACVGHHSNLASLERPGELQRPQHPKTRVSTHVSTGSIIERVFCGNQSAHRRAAQNQSAKFYVASAFAAARPSFKTDQPVPEPSARAAGLLKNSLVHDAAGESVEFAEANTVSGLILKHQRGRRATETRLLPAPLDHVLFTKPAGG